jgi:aryl-alcohol dehydrogenase-like predicted oxidoreductase
MMDSAILGGVIPVSRIGIGGHYRAMEEGAYEERFAYVDREIEARLPLIRRAVAAGITYFDTTWRNEVEVLGRTLAALGLRDRVVVNGMVLGAFAGSAHAGVSVEDYTNRWLDERLARLPGNRFDTFMVNAIEESYDEKACARLVRLLAQRQAAGAFRLFGFSTHNPFHGRAVADRFPEFRTIMLPYNFRNRAFEQAFADYTGTASFIAMKTLVWAEYGIPFCAPNRLPDGAALTGFAADRWAAARALRFVRANPRIQVAIAAVNEPDEVEVLIAAGEGTFAAADEAILARYNAFHEVDGGLPFFISGLYADNLRLNYFALAHLARVLAVPLPAVALNEPDSRQRLFAALPLLAQALAASGNAHYAELVRGANQNASGRTP